MSGDCSDAGRLFHVVHPCIAKLRWPIDVRAHGTIRTPNATEHRCWWLCCSAHGPRGHQSGVQIQAPAACQLSAYSEIYNSGRRRGFACILLNLWQATSSVHTGLSRKIIGTSPSISLPSPVHSLHTHTASKSSSSSAPPTPGYTRPSFPFREGLHIGPS